jgi:HK97 family phage portal protein
MNWDWLKPRGGYARQNVDSLIGVMEASYGAMGVGGLPTDMTDHQIRASYNRWQYAAATAVADAVSLVPWKVQVYGKTRWSDAPPDHPLYGVLEHPNSIFTGVELFYLAIVDCMLVGKHYWYIVLNGLNEPVGLLPLMGKVSPVLDRKTREVTEWKHEIHDVDLGQVVERLPRERVVCIRLPKPGSYFKGFGPGQAASSSIRLDKQVVEAEWAAFKQGVFPFAVIHTSEPSARKRQQFLSEFESKYSGVAQTGKALMVSSKSKVEFPGRAPMEMGFAETEVRIRESILGVFRVPGAMIGLTEQFNKANIQGAEYIFSRWRVAPLLRLTDSRINQDLTTRYWDARTRVVHDSPVPEDREQTRRDWDTWLRHGAVTRDEHRATVLGLGPIEGGDQLLVSKGYVPITEVTSPSAKKDEEAEGDGAEEESAGIPTKARASPPKATKGAPKGFSLIERQAIAIRFMQERADFELHLRQEVERWFTLWGQALLAALDESEEAFGGLNDTGTRTELARRLPPGVNRLLTPDWVARDMANFFLPANRRGLFLGGPFERSLIADPKEFKWRPGSKAIDSVAAQFSAAHYEPIASVTTAAITDVIADQMKSLATFREMRSAVVTELGAMKESRATTISSTVAMTIWRQTGRSSGIKTRSPSGRPNALSQE